MEGCWWVMMVAAFTCTTGVLGQTIHDVIKQRPELDKLKIYMERLDFFQGTLSQSTLDLTFFAPINEAFDDVPSWIQIDLKSNTAVSENRIEPMFMNHAIFNKILQSADIHDAHYKSMADGGPSLFTRSFNGEQFVNGARLITKDLQCSNGVIHIIDTFLYEPAATESVTQYLNDHVQDSDLALRTSKFVQLLNKYSTLPYSSFYDLQGSANKFVTVFVPSDEYLGQLSNDVLLGLERNDDLMKVINAHIITSANEEDASTVVHSQVLVQSQLANLPIDASEGTISITSMADNIYVSNNCAQGQITRANITVDNGVIHMINGLLGYLFYDAYQLIQSDTLLNALEMYVMQTGSITNLVQVSATALTAVPESEKITLFAADDSAFQLLSDWGYDISANTTRLNMVLHASLISGVVKTTDMTNNTVIPTMQPGISARFYQYPNGETFVEIDHVISKIVRPDFCVRNGVVHFVDRVPATPYKTIWQEISSADDLIDLYSAIRQVGLDQVLNDMYRRWTFFAPTNDAFVMMREGAVGRSFLDPGNGNVMQELVKRHFVSGEIYLDTITSSKEVTSEAGVKYTIRKEPGVADQYVIDYDDKIITVKQRDIQMTNGVLNIIDSVIYKETPRDLELVAAGVMCQVTTATVLLSIFVSLLSWS